MTAELMLPNDVSTLHMLTQTTHAYSNYTCLLHMMMLSNDVSKLHMLTQTDYGCLPEPRTGTNSSRTGNTPSLQETNVFVMNASHNLDQNEN
jgi:hypothetical protein